MLIIEIQFKISRIKLLLRTKMSLKMFKKRKRRNDIFIKCFTFLSSIILYNLINYINYIFILLIEYIHILKFNKFPDWDPGIKVMFELPDKFLAIYILVSNLLKSIIAFNLNITWSIIFNSVIN